MKFEHTSGGFTLPGESGQEKLTLELAKKWGADVIRDSDGTQLSDEILDAGYDIYSTICIIRDHNAWAKEHPECLQQYEYFEIFLNRMLMCRGAADLLGATFKLTANGAKVL